jgi:hypothetical protein
VKNPGLTFAQQFGCITPHEAIQSGKASMIEWCEWIAKHKPVVLPRKKNTSLEDEVMELLEKMPGANGFDLTRVLGNRGNSLTQVLNRLERKGITRRERAHPDKKFPIRNWLVEA